MFLISAFITSQSAYYLKKYWSEESKLKRERRKMEKLKNALIKESKMIKIPKNPSSKKIQKIYKFALNPNYPRGGQSESFEADLESQFSMEYTVAQRIQKIILQTLIYLRSNEANKTRLRLILTATRLGIELVLIKCNIEIKYILVDGISRKFAVISSCTGGTFGFIYGWFTAGTLVAGPPTILTALQKVVNFSKKIATDKKFRDYIFEMIKEKNKQVAQNYQSIKLDNLNWNSNPEIKEAAERLGIFNNPPKINEPLHINTLDFDLEFKQALEELGLLQKPKTYSSEELNEFIKKTLEQNQTKVPNFSTTTPNTNNIIEIH